MADEAQFDLIVIGTGLWIHFYCAERANDDTDLSAGQAPKRGKGKQRRKAAV